MTNQMTTREDSTPQGDKAQTCLSQAGLSGQPTSKQMKLIGIALAVLSSAVVGLSLKVFFFTPPAPQVAFVDMDALISPQAQRIARQAMEPSMAGPSMARQNASREVQAIQHVVEWIRANMTAMALE